MSTEAQPIVSETSKVEASEVLENKRVDRTPEELFEIGSTTECADDAIDFLSEALEKIVAKNGELHPSTARYYHEYGRRLVEASKADQDVFAKIEAKVNQPEEEKQENAEDEEAVKKGEAEASPEHKAAQEATGAGGAAEQTEEAVKPAEPSSAEASSKPTASSDEPVVKPGKEEAEPSSKSEEPSAVVPTPSDEMIEARELAWELLESARVVYTKNEAEHTSEIAAVHCLLGDVAMEDGNFQRAYPEYVKATQIYGKHGGVADKRLGGAHQLAGLCALYDQQNEASIFHYTAAAEAFNNTLAELLVKEGIMETPSQETEDIEFIDEALIEKLQDKVGADSAQVKDAKELNGIINNLIERVEEIQDQMENDAKNPKMQQMIQKLGQKIAEQFKAQEGETSSGFDKPTSAPCEGATEINIIVPKKRPASSGAHSATEDASAKRQKLENAEEAK